VQDNNMCRVVALMDQKANIFIDATALCMLMTCTSPGPDQTTPSENMMMDHQHDEEGELTCETMLQAGPAALPPLCPQPPGGCITNTMRMWS
jgi:hypothetical protein